MEDPAEEGDIPHCTLKMFPEETLHCVEWARDKFGKIFSQKPKALKKCLEIIEAGTEIAHSDLKALKDAVSLIRKAPKDFDDCISYARKKFQKFFHNDIRQLMYVYPEDHMDKDGNPFWRLPKRPPTHLEYDPKTELHRDFIIAFACLRAKIFGIPLPKNIREDKEMKEEVSGKATVFK